MEPADSRMESKCENDKKRVSFETIVDRNRIVAVIFSCRVFLPSASTVVKAMAVVASFVDMLYLFVTRETEVAVVVSKIASERCCNDKQKHVLLLCCLRPVVCVLCCCD